MTAPKVSIVIVSHSRPDHLSLCLESLKNQTYPSFEVVVVADYLPPEFTDLVRHIPFTDENISAARNIGIANAATNFIAFCDDDAIPDPPWLERLMAPFEDLEIGSTGGFTRGRNGISLQWGAMRFDREGQDHPFSIDETAPFQAFSANIDTPVKLIGTNMAFRKTALLEVGGFDEAFHFFLEDADIKLRLDKAGWKSALVPGAQVHHSFAASSRRTRKRIPTNLYEIGASKAYFCKKHSDIESKAISDSFAAENLKRLKRINRSDTERLMQSLKDGMENGLTRDPFGIGPIIKVAFQKFPTHSGTHILVCAGFRDHNWLKETALDLLTKGHRVSVIHLTPTTLYFQVSFKDGYWLHKGGVWGKSDRTQPLIQITNRRERFIAEQKRIENIYPIDAILHR